MSSKPPIVSVLVPTYRRPDLLARCLNKLKIALDRESHRFELLVGDNSDLPENKKVLEEFSYSWGGSVNYFGDSSGRNMQENWNNLALNARGSYLQYVHDDDFLLPRAGECLLAIARRNRSRPIPVKFGVKLVQLDEKLIRIEGPRSASRLSPSVALRNLISQSSYIRFPSMFLPRVQLIDSGIFDVSASIQDWPTWLALAAKHGIEQRAELTAAYTIHEGAGTNLQFHDDYLLELVTLLEKYAVSFPTEEARCLVSSFIYKWILAGAHRAWRSGDIPAMKQRLAMIQSPVVQPYRCPLMWTPLLFFFNMKSNISILKKSKIRND